MAHKFQEGDKVKVNPKIGYRGVWTIREESAPSYYLLKKKRGKQPNYIFESDLKLVKKMRKPFGDI